MSTLYTLLPSMNTLLDTLEQYPHISIYPRILIRNAVAKFLDILRNKIKDNSITNREELERYLHIDALVHTVYNSVRPHFRRVLNGTGVVLHTNAGRAILAEEAIEAVHNACKYYSNLELDLSTGERGSRYSHVEELLCTITGAESALVVNNNAAAVLLILDSLCKDKEVIASRGQLVEIGGSFRIPDVMTKSGTILKEVGTTNRTHLQDYENAITENTSAIIRIHTSNFKIIGFTKTVELEDLVELGKKYALPIIDDLGSGSLFPLASYGLSDEPTVQKIVSAGVDIVSFSGDKVLGGPQAGIIVGKKKYIDILKKNQLTRALRIDKMTLAALEATLRLYLVPDTLLKNNPTLKMLTVSAEELQKKASLLLTEILTLKTEAIRVKCVGGFSKVGGGSFPEETLPTTIVHITCLMLSAEDLREKLLATDISLLVRIENECILLDVRTLTEEEFPFVVKALETALTEWL